MPQRADARRNRARILAAAEEVFAERGPSASTEEVAARAGLAIGTIFRHFPTKQALLQAIMKGLLERLTEEAEELAEGDAADGLFTFFSRTVQQAAHKRTVIDLLAQNGSDLQIAEAVQPLNSGIQKLLTRAQQVGAVRPEVRSDEVVALLAAACQGTIHGGWDPDLQQRALSVIFRGLE